MGNSPLPSPRHTTWKPLHSGHAFSQSSFTSLHAASWHSGHLPRNGHSQPPQKEEERAGGEGRKGKEKATCFHALHIRGKQNGVRQITCSFAFSHRLGDSVEQHGTVCAVKQRKRAKNRGEPRTRRRQAALRATAAPPPLFTPPHSWDGQPWWMSDR